ncbi:MAG: flagellar biosynthetic protein FliR [Betaproteobacteria bacterium]|nr:flagellar biosynthetic protein FliR [Betaproteobacteria bacterium]
MNLSLASLLDQFYSLIWPLLRVTAFMVFSSLFSVRAINVRIRVVISLVLTVFIAMEINIPRIDPITVQGLEVIFQQIFIGFTMGMIMQIATASVVVAGQAVSGSMGLSMANMIDPTLGNVPVIAGFFTTLSTLVFMSIGGHLIVFGILLESFRQFPIGVSFWSQALLGKMISWSSLIFLAGLLIALPVVVTLLFVNIGLGFISRSAPSLNIFSVGFPAMVLSGFAVLWLATPSIIERIAWTWVQSFDQLRSLMLN